MLKSRLHREIIDITVSSNSITMIPFLTNCLLHCGNSEWVVDFRMCSVRIKIETGWRCFKIIPLSSSVGKLELFLQTVSAVFKFYKQGVHQDSTTGVLCRHSICGHQFFIILHLSLDPIVGNPHRTIIEALWKVDGDHVHRQLPTMAS